jgi:hypothetical protein
MGDVMEETCDRCGPAVRAAYRTVRNDWTSQPRNRTNRRSSRHAPAVPELARQGGPPDHEQPSQAVGSHHCAHARQLPHRPGALGDHVHHQASVRLRGRPRHLQAAVGEIHIADPLPGSSAWAKISAAGCLLSVCGNARPVEVLIHEVRQAGRSSGCGPVFTSTDTTSASPSSPHGRNETGIWWRRHDE